MDRATIDRFLDEYFAAYHAFVTDRASIDGLDRFWHEELEALTYTRVPLASYPVRLAPRSSWKKFMLVSHGFFDEHIEPTGRIIDADTGQVGLRGQIIGRQKGTDREIARTDIFARYTLEDGGRGLAMTRIELFLGDPSALAKSLGGPVGVVRFMLAAWRAGALPR